MLPGKLIPILALLLLASCAKSNGTDSPSPIDPPHTETASVQGTESSAGGGNAVVCFDDPGIPAQIRAAGGELEDRFIQRIRSVEMLDLYQAREERGLDRVVPTLIEPDPGQESAHYIDTIASRFRNIIPELANFLYWGANSFSPNALHWTKKGLAKIDDARFEEHLDANCVLATMAAQFNGREQSQLKIDSRLYWHPAHSELSKAVLLLHESLYAAARNVGHTNSVWVRRVVGYLIVEYPKYHVQELIDLLNMIRPMPHPHFQTQMVEWVERAYTFLESNVEKRRLRKMSPKQIQSEVIHAWRTSVDRNSIPEEPWLTPAEKVRWLQAVESNWIPDLVYPPSSSSSRKLLAYWIMQGQLINPLVP